MYLYIYSSFLSLQYSICSLLFTHCIISFALFALFTFDLSLFFSLLLLLSSPLPLSHLLSLSLLLKQTNYPASDLIMNWSQFVLNSFQYQPQFLNGAQRPSPISSLDSLHPTSSTSLPLPLSASLFSHAHNDLKLYVVY